MVNNQKGFANIILVVIIVVLVGAVGYFAFVKKSEPIVQQPTPTPTQIKTPVSPTPTSKATNLKTYTNTQYGFQFQYPSSWSVVGPGPGNSVTVYGSKADLASINIRYYEGLKDLPLNPISHKPYDYFNQYVMDTHFFKEQKLMSLNSGTAESAVLVQDPSIKVVLIGGNGHFYEIGYQIRYDQTWTQLEQIIQSFKFTK